MLPFSSCRSSHDSEIGGDLSYSVLHLTQYRGTSSYDIHTIFLHLRIDALGVIKDTTHCCGFSKSRIRYLQDRNGNSISTIFLCVWGPCSWAAFTGGVTVPDSEHFGCDCFI